MIGAIIGSGPAGAAGMPATPTVHVEAGLDNIVSLSEAGALNISGTWDALDPDIVDIIVDVTIAPLCDGTGGVVAEQHAIPWPDGTFTAGPFDVSGLADDSLLCARAFAVWDDATLSVTGLSDNTPLLNISVAAGTVSFNDANAVMNAAEAATVGGVTVTYGHPDPYVVSAGAVFLSATNTIVDPSCSLGSALAPGGTVSLPVACATALPEGVFSVKVTWTDNGGNTAFASATLLKDSVSSVPVIVSPAQFAQLRPAPFTVAGSSEPGASVKLFHVQYTGDAGDLLGSATANASGAWSIGVSGLHQGNRHLVARATDVPGNLSSRSPERIVVIDATVPYIVTPVADSLQPRYFTVTGIGRPSDTVRVFSGETKIGETQVHPNGSWSLQATRPTGTATIYARGYVNGNASDASELMTFIVDADIPAAAITTPIGEATFLPGNVVTLEGTASDPAGANAGVARVRIIYTDGIRGNTIGTEVAGCSLAVGTGSCGAGATSVKWKANALPAGPGVIVVSVYSEDMAGNVSAVKTIRYTRL